MALFEAKYGVIKTRILEESELVVVMEVAFIGVHDHLSHMVTNIQKICEIEFFEDPQAGLAFLRWTREKSKGPSAPPAAP